jgi:hypothetical protein
MLIYVYGVSTPLNGFSSVGRMTATEYLTSLCTMNIGISAGCHGNVVEFTSVHLTKRLHDHSLNGLQLLRVLRARIGGNG